MQAHTAPKPETVELLSDIYQALDTMREDTDELATVEAELLPDCVDDPEALATLNAEVARAETLIAQRRRYVLGAVIGNTALDAQSIEAASLAYVAGFESVEGQQSAAWRVWMYNGILRQVWNNKAVPIKDRREVLAGDPGQAISPQVRILGRTDPRTGRTWVNLFDARTVLHSEPIRAGDKVIAEYNIVSSHVNDAGETVAVIMPPGMPERTVVFPPNSRVWRIKDGRLELFLPPDNSSVEEVELSSLEKFINSFNTLTQVAVRAAGANVPNVAERFEDPRGKWGDRPSGFTN